MVIFHSYVSLPEGNVCIHLYSHMSDDLSVSEKRKNYSLNIE
jgi:hypothetical protein